MKPLLERRINDEVADNVRRSHAEAIVELQRLDASGLSVIPGVQLADGVPTTVAHKLGRAPIFVRESCVRGATSAGVVRDFGTKNPVTGAANDRTRTLLLQADGYGAAITVDLMVL